MRLENARLRAPRSGANWLERVAACLPRPEVSGAHPLRFSLVDATDDEVVVEATLVHFDDSDRHADQLRVSEIHDARRKRYQHGPFTVVNIVPTGVRCEIGGFAGDVCPATNLLASAADIVVTHPNAVNASELNERADNVWYVEGRSLDDFLLGHVGLLEVAGNRIGTFVDPTGLEYVELVERTLDAAKTTGGIACGDLTVLRSELGAEIEWSDNGCAVGTIRAPEVMLDAIDTLLDAGAQAVGGVSVIHGVAPEMFHAHHRGEIPNPSGGVEAIITHLVSKLFRVPTAHAPLPYYQDFKRDAPRDPRGAAEFISTPHYFSVLKGLHRAPRVVPIDGFDAPPGLLTLESVAAIVVPASCLGGVPALAGEYNDIPVIAVRENATVLKVTNDVVAMPNVVEVESYLEAAGAVLALREGIALESVRRPVNGARRV